MKAINLFLSSCIFILFLSSCESKLGIRTTRVDFEFVAVDTFQVHRVVDNKRVTDIIYDSICSGKDIDGKFTSANLIFINHYTKTPTEVLWSGFACSSKKGLLSDKSELYPYSSATGSGALKTLKFAVVHDSATISCAPNYVYGAYSIKNLMITNSIYTYSDILNGSSSSKKFVANDWYKVTFTGYRNNIQTGAVDFYLADYRNGKSLLLNSWAKVDLSSLGEVDRVSITFDSSDKTNDKINTPVYCCIDDIELTQNDTK